MQFAHSGSQTEKQPPPHPELPHDATAGAPHSAESTPSHGVAPRSLQAPHPHHPTAPRSRLFTPLRPCRSMMPDTYRPTTPRPCLFATLHLCHSMVPCAYRPTAPHLRHTMLPSPTPLTVPRQVRLAPPSAPLQSRRKSGNKKVIKIATFLRLAIAAESQITDRAPKMKQNDRSVPHFHFTGDEKEPLIAKKLQKRQDFCFRKANYRNRSRFRNEPIAKREGRSPDEPIAATRRTP